MMLTQIIRKYPAIGRLINQARDGFFKLSRREQTLIGMGVVFIILMACYLIYSPISDTFAAQSMQLSDVMTRSRSTAGALERYLKLRSRKDAIEGRYREVEFKEGAYSHLENLIKNKAGVQNGFLIKDGQARSFGGGYEQIPISIKFSTSNVPALVDFLKEIVHGKKPLILSRLDISKPRRGDRLDVDMDVGSLRHSSAPTDKSTK